MGLGGVDGILVFLRPGGDGRYSVTMMHDENVIEIDNKLRIPKREIEFQFSTGGGPGGQHANRAATRVTLRFDVVHSPSLDEKTRRRLLKRLENRIDKYGVLQVSAQESRSQHRNRQAAIARFQTILANALQKRKKRRKTRPSRAANERRLRRKKRRGQKKKERSWTWDG